MRLALSIEPVYRISTALRTISNRDSENPSKLVFRNEHHRRGCSLFSIDIQFAKVEVAGSNPVSRSFPPPTWPLSSRTALIPREGHNADPTPPFGYREHPSLRDSVYGRGRTRLFRST